MWDNLQQDRWFELLPDDPEVLASSAGGRVPGTDWEYPQAALALLQGNSRTLSRGRMLRVLSPWDAGNGWEGGSWTRLSEKDFRHSDYEFFAQRSAS
jgi:hypothetical protein